MLQLKQKPKYMTKTFFMLFTRDIVRPNDWLYHANTNQKAAGLTILISDKLDIMAGLAIRERA